MPSRLSEAGHGDVNDVGFDGFQHVVTKAEALHYPRTKIFDDNVGNRNQFLDNLKPFRSPDVEGDSPFVGVGVGELAGGVGSGFHALGDGEPVLAQDVQIIRPLYLDNFGPKCAQPTGGPRTGPYPGEVHHSDSL